MRARSTPYPAPGYAVCIGAAIWDGAIATVRAYAMMGSERGRRGSEALVCLGGVVAGDEMIVTGLYRLHHEPQGDRVVVTPDEARWLLRTLRARDEKLVAQLHSHRRCAGHSHGDDAWAASFHDGFLSIVVPHFATGVTAPVDCAVLDYRDGEFVELSRAEIVRRIAVVPEIVERVALPPAKEKRWHAFAQRLKSTAPKLR